MEESSILITALLFGLFVGLLSMSLIDNVIYYWTKAKKIMSDNKEFARRTKEIKKMKEDGDFHEWVEIPNSTGTTLVCKKTGWTPSLKGFLSVKEVERYLNKVKLEKEYKEYRDVRVSELAEELGFDLPKMESIVEKIFSIKKDFSVGKIKDLADEMMKRAEDAKKQ